MNPEMPLDQCLAPVPVFGQIGAAEASLHPAEAGY
jgi:hypothetical protein